MEQITFAPTFSAWQKSARAVLTSGISPNEIAWNTVAEIPAHVWDV